MEKKEFLNATKALISKSSKAGEFFKSMKNRMGIGSPEKNATDAYERGMRIVPDNIRTSENEFAVKQYNVAVLRNMFKFERAEGRMQVTNKRVVFRAAGRSVGGRTTLQHEFAINEIAGIEARKNFKFSFIYLIFALLIINFTNSAINGKLPEIPEPSIEGIIGYFMDNNDNTRISSILSPSHIHKLRVREREVRNSSNNLPDEHTAAITTLNRAKVEEERAEREVEQGGVLRTRRVQTGIEWWGDPIFVNEQFRDLSAAEEALDAARTAREEAEKNESLIKGKLEAAEGDANRATRRRVFAERFWVFLMTILGIIFGIGALIPFFILNKRFGLKIFILNFSVFGWVLALTASGFAIFNIFKILAIIAIIICVLLFCFRPNLIISIKSKSGRETIDIRRDTLRNANRTGFSEVIPTDETESIIREIGAIILDIQQNGDSALEKWSK